MKILGPKGSSGQMMIRSGMTNVAAISAHIQHFQSVHPNIYSIYKAAGEQGRAGPTEPDLGACYHHLRWKPEAWLWLKMAGSQHRRSPGAWETHGGDSTGRWSGSGEVCRACVSPEQPGKGRFHGKMLLKRWTHEIGRRDGRTELCVQGRMVPLQTWPWRTKRDMETWQQWTWNMASMKSRSLAFGLAREILNFNST